MYIAQTTKNRIKQICKDKKLNAKQMLLDCSLGANAIQQINDTKGMASFSLAKIADYLDCSVDYLLGRTDNPEVNKWNEVVTIQKISYVSGYCPFLDEEVTIKVTYTRYAPLGAEPLAKPVGHYCDYGSDCRQGDNCPVFDQTFPWNEI